MTPPNQRSSGILMIATGILFGSFMVFHPENSAQGAMEAIWIPVHGAWFLSYLLLTCSFVPLYLPLMTSGTALAKVSYWLAGIVN